MPQITNTSDIFQQVNCAPVFLFWYRSQIQLWQLQQSHYYWNQAFRTHGRGNVLSVLVGTYHGSSNLWEFSVC